MKDILFSYPKLKNSNIPWIGSIPAHWGKVHGGAVLKQKHVSNRGLIENAVLSLSYGKIVVKPLEKLHGLVPESFETYQIVDPYDIIVRPTDLQNDWVTIRVGISFERGIITSAYICMRALKPIKPEYAYLLLLAYDLKKIFYGMGSGLRQNLDWSDFKRLPMLLPPSDEQEKIISYIKYVDALVARFIQNRQSLIALLKEQKQEIINHAVTKGLDQNAKMKPSGIEWLGDIPEGWEVKPLKHFVKSNIETLTEKYDINATISYIDISTVGFGELKQEPVQYVFRDAPSRARRIIHTGDTIISTVRTYLKSICYVDDELDGCIASTGFAVLTPSNNVFPKLLNYVLSADYFVNSVSQNSIGVSYPAISESRLIALKIAISPDIKEQQKILEYIQQKIMDIDQAIERVKKEIGRITEYRTSLISNVATGKIDVRNIEAEDVLEEIEEDVEDFGEEPLEEEEISVGEGV